MFKRILSALALAFVMLLPAVAQQYQTSDLPPYTPLYATNAKYANGVSPGYAPTAAATGLTLNVSGGTAFILGSISYYAAGTLTMTNNTTNYIFLNSSGVPSASTSVFGSSVIPIAIVTTSGGNITSIVDVRTPFMLTSGGGGGSVTIETNSTLNSSQLLLNFTNPSSFNGLSFIFANPSGGIETFGVTGTLDNSGITHPSTTVNGQTCVLGGSCTISAGSGPLIQVNDSSTGVSQTVLDFNSTTPAPPGGYVNVIWQNDTSTGRKSAYVPAGSTPTLVPQILPPVTGQSVIIYPSAYTLITGGTVPGCGPTGTAEAAVNSTVGGSGVFTTTGCSSGLGGGTWGANYTGFSLPSYVLPSNVTAIYAVAVANFPANLQSPYITNPNAEIYCADSPLASVYALQIASPSSDPVRQFSALMSAYAGSTVSTIQCQADVSIGADPFGGSSVLNLFSMALIVYYTGSAPPAPTGINIVSPLTWNASNNQLGIDTSYAFPGYNLEPVTVSTLPNAALYPSSIFNVKDGPSCTTPGGSTTVECISIGGVWTNFSGAGSVTAFIASAPSWPTWLVPTVTLSTSTPTLAVAASPIPNAALANPATTVNGQTCTLGSTCTISTTTVNPVDYVFAVQGGTGTTNKLTACWNTTGNDGIYAVTCPVTATGTNNNPTIIGICENVTINAVAYTCGTSGIGAFAVSGDVPWLITNQTYVSDILFTSGGTAGYGIDSAHGAGQQMNENPELNTVIGVVSVANAGIGTATTVHLTRNFGSYATGISPGAPSGQSLVLHNFGSNFDTQSYFQQCPLNATPGNLSCDPKALIVPWVDIEGSAGNGYMRIDNGQGGKGTSTRDFGIDTLSYGIGLPPNEAFYFNTSMYTIPTALTCTGTKALVVDQTTGLYTCTLTGSTTFTISADNAGNHDLIFDLTQNGSTAYTVTWPSDFVNPPTMTTTLGGHTVAGFYFNGTNHICMWGCGTYGIQNIQVTIGTTTVTANTCTGAATVAMAGLDTTSVIFYTPATDISAITGWSSAGATLYFVTWPTFKTLNYKVCNGSSSDITPGSSTTWNFGAK